MPNASTTRASRYWIWATEAADELDARINGRPDVVDRLNLAFDDGARIARDVPEIEIRIREDEEGRLTDNLIAKGTTGLVFNERLRTLLAGLGVDNVDYYPARVVSERTGAVDTSYMVANLIGTVRCVDQAQSDVEYRPSGSIRFINRLVLDESAPKGMLMFRLAEFLPMVIVDDRVKTEVSAAGVTGVRFYRPDEYVL